MQTITNYEHDGRIRLLLQGPPGSGKSTVACQFPHAYIADCDINLGGPLRFLQKNKMELPVGYDIIDHDENGKVIPLGSRWERLINRLNDALGLSSVETVVIDSATRLCDYIRWKITGGKDITMTLQQWGEFGLHWKQLIGRLIAQKKHFVLVAHESIETDAGDEAQKLKHFVGIPGATRFIIGALFTDIWRCEVTPPAFGAKDAKHRYVVRTLPDNRFNLKNGLGLDPVVEFSWDLIASKLNGQ